MILNIAALIFALSNLAYISWMIFQGYKNKAYVREFEYKQNKVKYHIDYSDQLKDMFLISGDNQYLEYAQQELDKAGAIIETYK